MAELVDAPDSKSGSGDRVSVRFRPPAPHVRIKCKALNQAPSPPGSIGRGPHVVAIQSQVAHGHVGNSAAVFPMQALGIEVAAVPTTLLSNHPIYPTMRGRVLDAALVADLFKGLEERGLIEAASAVLTGYLGSAENGAVIADFIARAKARNPALLYVCDPVIGDEGSGVFVAEGVVAAFRDRLVPAASILTPNQFELELLAGAAARSAESLCAAAASLGPRRAVVDRLHARRYASRRHRNHRL